MFNIFKSSAHQGKTSNECLELATMGDPKYQFLIAHWHESEMNGFTKDGKAVIKWATLAADQNWKSASDLLGYVYSVGACGIPQNYELSAKWYLKGAEQGHPGCQFEIGKMFLDGIGVSKDITLAHMWINLASCSDIYKKKSIKILENMESQMTQDQIKISQKMATERFFKT